MKLIISAVLTALVIVPFGYFVALQFMDLILQFNIVFTPKI